ncbi:Aldehyde dehydrogenase [Phytophthora ramorum]|nr:Aldehyde dehydrogenase, mitochondrial [Phytophthora ramorum]
MVFHGCGRISYRLTELIEENVDELLFDDGKPCSVAKTADLGLVIEILRYYAGWLDKIDGSAIPTSRPYLCYTKTEPISVCDQVTPWKFPLLLTAWKLRPVMWVSRSC